jgi:hypothetical protein
VAALTVLSAKGAIGGALAHLATAAGAGAALGKPMGRLLALAQERLIGSKEFEAVEEATNVFDQLLAASGDGLANDALSEGRALVLEPTDTLAIALGALRDLSEVRK